jgi:hypothetical protein
MPNAKKRFREPSSVPTAEENRGANPWPILSTTMYIRNWYQTIALTSHIHSVEGWPVMNVSNKTKTLWNQLGQRSEAAISLHVVSSSASCFFQAAEPYLDR